jgi:hypothetical protein
MGPYIDFYPAIILSAIGLLVVDIVEVSFLAQDLTKSIAV